jgi:hypothetical protein
MFDSPGADMASESQELNRISLQIKRILRRILMSTSAVSSSSLSQPLQSYFQTRKSDLQQLGEALSSGNVANAQTAYNSINKLGQGGPFSNGQPFISQQREQDFNTMGKALQSGDLAGAQQAFATLESSFHRSGPLGPAPAPVVPVSSGPEIVLNLSNGSNSTTTAAPIDASNSGPEIVLNLSNGSNSTTTAAPVDASNSGPEIVLNLSNGSNSTTPEQITINISNPGNGSPEQVSLSMGNQQASSQPEITFNLNPNSNQQIVLNLNSYSTASASGTSSTSAATSGGLSVSA